MNLTKQKTELIKEELIKEFKREVWYPTPELKPTYEDVCEIAEKFLSQALDTIALAAREEAIKNAIKSLPEELGYDDYDKHIHSYVHENRGKCEICGLSWKMAGQYELYNNGIIACKKVLRSHLKEKQK